MLNARPPGSCPPAHQINVHDPAMPGPFLRAEPRDPVPHDRQWPFDQELMRHAEIGPPPDMDAGGIERVEGTALIQHHGDAVSVRRPTIVAQPAPGGDDDRRAEPVERDGVGRGQRLQAGDARHDAYPDRQPPLRQPVGDPQAAVIKGGIAPDQQGKAAAIGQVARDLPGPGLRDGIVPVLDAANICLLYTSPSPRDS